MANTDAKYNTPPSEIFSARGGVVVDVTAVDHVFDPPARAFYVGDAGDVKVITVNGDTLTFFAVPTGTLMPIAVSTFVKTGTNVLDTYLVGLR